MYDGVQTHTYFKKINKDLSMKIAIEYTLASFAIVLLSACGGGGGGAAGTDSPSYTISGIVSGLETGRQVTLLNNSNNPTVMNSNGNFSFSAKIPSNGSYSVTIGVQPTSQSCVVTNGSENNVTANISSVVVRCSSASAIRSNIADIAPPTVSTVSVSNTLNAGVCPAGIAVDSVGHIYVSNINKILKIDTLGNSTVFAGSDTAGDQLGQGSNARFSCASGLTVDANDNVYVSDASNNKIKKVAQDGTVTLYAGSGFPGTVDGSASSSRFYIPGSLAFDRSGNLFVADYGYGAIRKIDPQGNVTTFASLDTPTGIAVDANGVVYIGSNNSNIVRAYYGNGEVLFSIGSGLSGNSDGTGSSVSFFRPRGLAINPLNSLLVMSEGGSVAANFQGNNVLRLISPAAEVRTVAGSNAYGFVDGVGAAARFSDPSAITFDRNGNLFIYDKDQNKIRKVVF